MADDFDLVKISELPAATAPGEYDVLAGVQSGDTKQFSFATLLSWMEQAITATAIGAVPVTRKVNNKALGADITLTAADVGAAPAAAGVYFGHCSSLANAPAKAVTIDGLTALTYGTKIVVYFANAQTYNGTPTLNVNSLGAYEIHRSPNYAVGEYEWAAGTTLELVFRDYNGSQMWLIVARGHATTTYYGLTKLSSSTSDSSTSLAATPSAVKAAYDLANGKLDPGAILRFTAQAVSAGENQQILAISDAAITADHVLARIEFADPAYVTAAGSWATAAGSFTLSGTAAAATTADILLVKKGN